MMLLFVVCVLDCDSTLILKCIYFSTDATEDGIIDQLCRLRIGTLEAQ